MKYDCEVPVHDILGRQTGNHKYAKLIPCIYVLSKRANLISFIVLRIYREQMLKKTTVKLAHLSIVLKLTIYFV
jgi:hypothetical protein